MSVGNGRDYDPPIADYVRGERGGAAAAGGAGGSVYQPGVSERTLVIAILLPFLIVAGLGFYALMEAGNAVERSGDAIDAAQRAEDGAARAALELRLAQEDLMLLRTALRERGITVETAGDHD